MLVSQHNLGLALTLRVDLDLQQILQELADEVGTLNKTQTTLAFYYLMAYRRGQRGDNPMLEEEEHSRQAGCEPISDKVRGHAGGGICNNTEARLHS